jgi:hypothetical protein
MPPVVLPPGYFAVTARVDVIVTQIAPVPQPGMAANPGYQVTVNPWLVAPDPVPVNPPEVNTIVTIEWNFDATAAGANFVEFGLDFKTKNHFQGVSHPGPPRWRHQVDVPPAPPAGEIITLDLIDPMSLNAQDYEYIVNIELDNGLRIEIDPGYRVKP